MIHLLRIDTGLPYAVPALPPHLTAKDSSSKVRDSARAGHRTANSSGRSSTPPPLPKSASLPLHAPPPSSTPSQGDKSIAQRHAPPTTQQSPVVPSVVTTNATLSPSPQLQHSPSAVFDQSPVISDILRQIAASNTAVHDLRAQLSDYKSSAAESHSSIQTDLEAHRERKRTEDASRNELKSKTRTLEDSKRSAESVKREVEKKLKAAESARTNASERIERLDKEISQLRERMSEDERAIEDLVLHSGEKETEFQKELELKRKEIKVAEDVVAALNTRTKELEEKIAQEEERLKKAKEQAELKRQDRDFYPLHTVHSQEASPTMSPWSPISATQETLPSQDPHAAIHTDRSEHIEVFPQIFQLPSDIPHVGTRSRGSSGSSSNMGPTEFSTTVSPRPRKLSLGIISNFREHPRAAANPEPPNSSILVNHPTSTQISIRPPNSYPLFNDTLTGPVPSTRFAPFGDNEIEVPPPGIHDIGAPSPKSTSLIPTSLIQSLEGPTSVEDLSRSFKSDSDDFLERDWRTGQPYVLNQAGVAVDSPAGFSSSPTSLNHPGFDGIDKEDPFEVRPPPSLSLRHRVSAAESGDLHHPQLFPHPNRTSSEPQPLVRSRTRESDDSNVGTAHGTAHKRWFSSSHKDNTKEKKGLNPEAKVFQLKKPSNPTMRTVAPAKYDTLPSMSSHGALPPLNGSTTALPLPPPPAHSAAPGSFMDSFLSTLSMRAFAPSPAEREALTRALGSSTNTSLERLPTLSEVSIASMPSSPSHVHAHTHAHTHAHAHVHGHGHGHHSHTHGAPSSSHAHDVVVGAGRPASSVPSGLAWLHNLPRMRKSKFSPWEDEDPSSSSGNGHAAF